MNTRPPAQSADPPPALEMIDAAVSSIYQPGSTALDHVHWTVRAGEYWVVGGLPGSGKSDLLATASGLMRPNRGTVRLFGKDLTRLREDDRVATQLRAGIVFGGGGRLFNSLTVADNLGLAMCYHQNCDPKASLERVHAVLDAVGLMDVADRSPVTLNRYVRQRAALARALVLEPELLFLDNPLAGVDPRETRWWLDFLDSLREGHPVLQNRRLTLVAGTDALGLWGERAQQFAYIYDREFRAVGDKANLLHEDNPALRELLPVGWLER